MSRFGSGIWRTAPEKEAKVDPVRIRRQRSVITETGRITDPEGTLLEKCATATPQCRKAGDTQTGLGGASSHLPAIL